LIFVKIKIRKNHAFKRKNESFKKKGSFFVALWYATVIKRRLIRFYEKVVRPMTGFKSTLLSLTGGKVVRCYGRAITKKKEA
jgi:hypothetical protein